MQKITNIIHYLLIASLIFIGILLFLSLTPLPVDFDLRIVQSGSMEPAIKTGSLILIKSADEYHEGDVITFTSSSLEMTPITHRVMEVEKRYEENIFITKGDANKTTDLRPVRESDVIGKTVLSIPILGYILNFAHQPIGFVFLIILPFLAISSEEIFKIVKITNSNKNYNENTK